MSFNNLNKMIIFALILSIFKLVNCTNHTNANVTESYNIPEDQRGDISDI